MTGPKFSVVVPTYNRVRDLERTLRGYERQEGAPPFELVVIDDGSTDATGELLAAYRSDRFALKTARQENGGPARPSGFFRASRPEMVERDRRSRLTPLPPRRSRI